MIFVKSTPIKVMLYHINCPFHPIKKGQHFKQLGCRQFSIKLSYETRFFVFKSNKIVIQNSPL